MARHLEIEIGRLKKHLLHLGAFVEQSFQDAVLAVNRRDAALGRQVLASGGEVDSMEVEFEEECLKVLALHQPVARDLRFIVALLKINNDLERVGDLAENLAERAIALGGLGRLEMPYDFSGMAESARAMLRGALDALANLDARAALDVCIADDRVDAINREMYRSVREAIAARPDQVDGLLQLLSASRYIERVADHATNIAEDVIYLLEGGIVRHRLLAGRGGEGPAGEQG